MDTLFEEAMEGSKISAKVNCLEINKKRINILTKSHGSDAVCIAEIREECSSFHTKLSQQEEVDDSLNPFL